MEHKALAPYGVRFSFAVLLFSAAFSLTPGIEAAHAQLSSSELYQQFQNRIGVADTLTEKLLAQRQAIRAGYDVQAMEGPVDPATYVLGPGDGVYLNVYAIHALDQDLTVTPEGRLLIPRIGQVEVAGLNLLQAQKLVNDLLSKDYKNPNASLTLRKLRPIKINILGEVLQPGVQSATSLQRVSEVIDRSGGFRPTSSLRNIEIRTPTGAVRAHADLFRYYALGDLNANPQVHSGDIIVVPSALRYVTLYGSVVAPGRMEYVEGDSLSTVFALAKGLMPSALTDSVEIARFLPNDPSHAQRLVYDYRDGQDPKLQDGDQIFVRGFTQYHKARSASIGGEVLYPGQYAIEPGVTRVKDIIIRAGGVLPTASLEEATLIRRAGTGSWENDAELQRLQNFAGLRKEGMSDEEYTYYTARVRQLTRSVMVVDFKSLLKNNDESQNILLREDDSIAVPRARGFVTVSGSVNNQGNVGYIEGGSFEDYIMKAGGFTSSADRSAVRVVNSRTGSYIDPRTERSYQISPGDMIIVPQEHSDFWKNLNTGTAITAQVLTIVAGIFLLVKK